MDRVLWGVLLCVLFPGVFGVEQFSLTPSVRNVVTNGSVCPQAPVTFTCIGTNLNRSSMYWYINGDHISSFDINSSPSSFPLQVDTNRSNVDVTVVSAQAANDGSIATINTTLSLDVNDPSLHNIACGSREARNRTLITCRKQMSTDPFVEMPTDQECFVNESAVFRCRPDSSLGRNVTWVVNGSIPIRYLPGFDASEDGLELRVTGCKPEWNGTIVSCVLTTSTQTLRPVPNDSKLIVIRLTLQLSPLEKLMEIVTTNWLYFFIALVAAVVLLMLSVICNCVCCCCCCCCQSNKKYNLNDDKSNAEHSGYHAYKDDDGDSISGTHRPRKRTDTDVRLEERKKQEKKERDEGLRAVQEIFPEVEPLPDLGSRLQKHWYRNKDTIVTIVTRAPIAKNCKLSFDIHTVSKLNRLLQELGALEEAALLQCNMEIRPSETEGSMYVITTQPIQKSSLRDLVYMNDKPLKDWSEKYECGAPLTIEQIRNYGRKILKGMQVLYSHGFPQLGHVHLGNIFVDGDVCRVGGYENTLLGYKTRLYRKISADNCLDDIDIIMFGHVMYEMSAGKELEGVVPTEEEYERIQEPKCRNVVQYIFTKTKKDGRFKHSIEKISTNDFFKRRPSLSLDAQDILDMIGGTRVTSGGSVVAGGGGAKAMAQSALTWFKGSKRASDKTPLVELA